MSYPLPSLSRRRFLATSVAAGAGLLLPHRLWANDKVVNPHLFVLISDIHLPGDRNQAWHHLKPVEAFASVRERIFDLSSRPYGVLVCGDVARTRGEPEDYATAAAEIKPFEEQEIPIHMLMGNHDNRENFLQGLPQQAALAAVGTAELKKFVSIWETPLVNWFLLDSQIKPNTSAGHLGEEQRKWLADALDARPGKPALVVAHHPMATPDSTEYVNGRSLIDGEELWDVLLPRKQVKAYIFGHCHRWASGEFQGMPWLNIPSTAWGNPRTEPSGLVICRMWKDGAIFDLDCNDKTHPKHGTRFQIPWRS